MTTSALNQRTAHENPFAGSGGHKLIHKFGKSATFSSGDVPVDLYTFDGGPGTLYPFPTAGATTTIQSTSDEDKPGGTGVPQAIYHGLTRDGLWIDKLVTLDGSTPITLPDRLFRAFRIACAGQVGAHASGTNVGNIQIKHGATILAQVDVGKGQTLMAIFTSPKFVRINADTRKLIESGGIIVPVTSVAFYGLYGSVHKQTATFADIVLQSRDVNDRIGPWRYREDYEAITAGTSLARLDYPKPLEFSVLMDVKLMAEATNGNNIHATGGFDIEFFW